MMKRYLLSLALLLSTAFALSGQNIQLHYDFGRALYSADQPLRPRLTSTVEMFRPDSWGSTFFFVDMNYAQRGVESAYWEVAREFRLAKSPFSAHLEYNGGLSNQFSYRDAYLVGLSYGYNKGSSAGFTLTPMYKYLAGLDKPSSWQLTGTWYVHLAKGALTFTGFADLWGDRLGSGADMHTVFLTEPQLWLNLNRLRGVDERLKLSIGTEVEISHNFAVYGETIINPTLAVKWTF